MAFLSSEVYYSQVSNKLPTLVIYNIQTIEAVDRTSLSRINVFENLCKTAVKH